MRVYAHEEWYVAQPESEATFAGRLVRRAVTQAPGARSALRFALITHAGETAIYAPGRVAALENLVDRNVVIEGKLVDLGGEGFGKELWIGSIAQALE